MYAAAIVAGTKGTAGSNPQKSAPVRNSSSGRQMQPADIRDQFQMVRKAVKETESRGRLFI